jgi:phenylalanyl-tRNA synthetase beta chain
MNILVPYSWLKEHIDTKIDAIGFAEATALVGNEAEQLLRPADSLKGMLVGRVVELKVHPNADKLKIAMTDIGTGSNVQIVCGGLNIAEGQIVAVAPPGTVVRWHGEEEMTLEETEVRGEKSYGMICAAEEIGFEKLATGEPIIWDMSLMIPDAKPGADLAEALGMSGEIVLDFETTTNRPDNMSILGQAREGYAASLGEMKDPLLDKPNLPVFEEASKYVFNVQVDDYKLCPRYMGIVLEVEVGPSPWWMQKRLLLAGAKPINNVVDVTNYVRLELGQPLHAFDYEKLHGSRIIVRRANDTENFLALDESEHELSSEILVIADAKKAVAVGGVMGGMDSGVSDATKTIVLEAAAFNPLSIRNTWRALNLQSDSQQLYEKGLSTELPAYGMARAIELLKNIASAKVASRVYDIREGTYSDRSFTLRPDKVSSLIGVKVDPDIQRAMLERLGFQLEKIDDQSWSARVPFWRDNDIEEDVDLTEEVARLYGYHNLPSELPMGKIPRRERDLLLDQENEIKDILSGHGWFEVYANSFVDPDDLKRAGFDPAKAIHLENPLSSDESVMRTNLLPTMLKVIKENQTHSESLRLFELQRVYIPREGDLPEERSSLVVALTDAEGGENLFRHIKGTLDLLSHSFHFEYSLVRENLPHWAHPGRSAQIIVGDEVVGTIAEVHPLLIQIFDIDSVPAVVEIDLPSLSPYLKKTPTYEEAAEFPSAHRDLALVVGEDVVFDELSSSIRSASELIRSVKLFDVYRGSQVGEDKKSLAIHLELRSDEKTLTSEEVDVALRLVTGIVESKHDASVRD